MDDNTPCLQIPIETTYTNHHLRSFRQTPSMKYLAFLFFFSFYPLRTTILSKMITDSPLCGFNVFELILSVIIAIGYWYTLNSIKTLMYVNSLRDNVCTIKDTNFWLSPSYTWHVVFVHHATVTHPATATHHTTTDMRQRSDDKAPRHSDITPHTQTH